MGWSASLSEDCGIGESIVLTPDDAQEGGYTVAAFSVPRDGIYRFDLKGSGGTKGTAVANYDGSAEEYELEGGAGGLTTGYLKLTEGETVYIGVGGTCCAAFIAAEDGTKLSEIAAENVRYVAGGGGAAGRAYRHADYRQASEGGDGGGTSGADSPEGGKGGTQTAGGEPGGWIGSNGSTGAYGEGGAGLYEETMNCPAWGGRGGDGYYGGGSGYVVTAHNSMTDTTSSYGYGGGGGSGYVYSAELTQDDVTYTSATAPGGGAASGENGSVTVTYAAETDIPVVFNGTRLRQLWINGVRAMSLIYDGTKVYMRRWRRSADCDPEGRHAGAYV